MSPRLRGDPAGWEADSALLTVRLRRLGLPADTEVHIHVNRTVMVSANGRGGVRIHRGYAYAPDGVLQAILTFLAPRVPRSERDGARRALLSFPVERYVVGREIRRRRSRLPEALRPLVERLRAEHEQLNRVHFDGTLAEIPIRLSARMTTCLGAVSIDRTSGQAQEIVMNRRHLETDPWPQVRDTLLHEMVHQWQVEQGVAPDHGRRFKAKAKAVGIIPAARLTTKATPAAASTSGRT